MKVTIIDYKDKRGGMWPDAMSAAKIEVSLYSGYFGMCRDRLEAELRDCPPAIILCHANDLVGKSLVGEIPTEFGGDYIARATKKCVYCVLYSGGGVKVINRTQSRLEIETNITTRGKIGIIEACVTDYIFVIGDAVLVDWQLPVARAAEESANNARRFVDVVTNCRQFNDLRIQLITIARNGNESVCEFKRSIPVNLDKNHKKRLEQACVTLIQSGCKGKTIELVREELYRP
jgi:hypothetical protein